MKTSIINGSEVSRYPWRFIHYLHGELLLPASKICPLIILSVFTKTDRLGVLIIHICQINTYSGFIVYFFQQNYNILFKFTIFILNKV
ncbi:Uncharacterised protein [Klebsiella pneumoniae]|uniref:Uncharacterized protein n=1 Tax=Klebsiella pneumoniae TaxID=573 RepID=A0A2X1Q853_KLEPN|nr:Uncharacterised protein [Klebsiella pneumoniae]